MMMKRAVSLGLVSLFFVSVTILQPSLSSATVYQLPPSKTSLHHIFHTVVADLEVTLSHPPPSDNSPQTWLQASPLQQLDQVSVGMLLGRIQNGMIGVTPKDIGKLLNLIAVHANDPFKKKFLQDILMHRNSLLLHMLTAPRIDNPVTFLQEVLSPLPWQNLQLLDDNGFPLAELFEAVTTEGMVLADAIAYLSLYSDDGSISDLNSDINAVDYLAYVVLDWHHLSSGGSTLPFLDQKITSVPWIEWAVSEVKKAPLDTKLAHRFFAKLTLESQESFLLESLIDPVAGVHQLHMLHRWYAEHDRPPNFINQENTVRILARFLTSNNADSLSPKSLQDVQSAMARLIGDYLFVSPTIAAQPSQMQPPDRLWELLATAGKSVGWTVESVALRLQESTRSTHPELDRILRVMKMLAQLEAFIHSSQAPMPAAQDFEDELQAHSLLLASAIWQVQKDDSLYSQGISRFATAKLSRLSRKLVRAGIPFRFTLRKQPRHCKVLVTPFEVVQ